MMHLSISHGKLVELLGTHLRKNIPTKKIRLKIDTETW